MTSKELETRLKECNPHLIVSTTNDGAAYDVEYVAEDKSRIVLYNFRIDKYGKAWGELTPIQLRNVRLLIDDYLNEIGDQNYYQLLRMWQIDSIDDEQYTEITANFEDVCLQKKTSRDGITLAVIRGNNFQKNGNFFHDPQV